jgi:membrane protein DedA with SNARE-associated domain
VRSDGRARRASLTLFLVPMIFVIALAQVGRALWPTLLAEAPWTLLLMSSTTTRLLLVQPLVEPHVFFSLAIGRVMLLAPLYYFFGRRYGDVALRWVERKLGPTSKIVGRAERFFRRFSYPLVAWSPNLIMSTMAGATEMRPLPFFTLALVGTIGRVTLIYFVGDWLATPIKEFADFVGRYQLILTPLSFTFVAVQLWIRRRKNRRIVETVDQFDSELQAIETELATEATVTSPRELD